MPNQPAESTRATTAQTCGAAWFCVRTHPKREHIAAAQLRHDPDIEVFLPRIRYRRKRRTGLSWVTEALFPNYLFARFDLAASLRRIQGARGVRGVVHFGLRWPAIPGAAIEELREAMGLEEIRVMPASLQPGDAVEISTGALGGLQAVISKVMSNGQRVAVLLDFLGRQTSVELPADQVVPEEGFHRLRAIRGKDEG